MEDEKSQYQIDPLEENKKLREMTLTNLIQKLIYILFHPIYQIIETEDELELD